MKRTIDFSGWHSQFRMLQQGVPICLAERTARHGKRDAKRPNRIHYNGLVVVALGDDAPARTVFWNNQIEGTIVVRLHKPNRLRQKSHRMRRKGA
jgi:hypothetical protein